MSEAKSKLGVTDCVECDPAGPTCVRCVTLLEQEAEIARLRTLLAAVDPPATPQDVELCVNADRLAREAKARLANTTPGPWIREEAQDGEMLPDGTGYAGDYYPTRTVLGDVEHGASPQVVADCHRGEDAEFIAHARQDVDALSDAVFALIAEVRRLSEERDELLALVEDRSSKVCECLRVLPYATASCGECGFGFTQVDKDLRPVVSPDVRYASFVTEEDRKR